MDIFQIRLTYDAVLICLSQRKKKPKIQFQRSEGLNVAKEN